MKATKFCIHIQPVETDSVPHLPWRAAVHAVCPHEAFDLEAMPVGVVQGATGADVLAGARALIPQGVKAELRFGQPVIAVSGWAFVAA